MGESYSVLTNNIISKMTTSQESQESYSSVPSWSPALARIGGFNQDGDWYNTNITRRMPLVPKMISELIYALPPLGNGKVLDLLSGGGALTIEVKKSYPRCKISALEKSLYRVKHCQSQLQSMGMTLDEIHNLELEVST